MQLVTSYNLLTHRRYTINVSLKNDNVERIELLSTLQKRGAMIKLGYIWHIQRNVYKYLWQGEKSSEKCITISWDLNPWVLILNFPRSSVPANEQTLISLCPQNFFFPGQKSNTAWILFLDLYCKKLKLVEEIMLTVPEEEQIEGLSVFEVTERIKWMLLFPIFGRVANGWVLQRLGDQEL